MMMSHPLKRCHAAQALAVVVLCLLIHGVNVPIAGAHAALERTLPADGEVVDDALTTVALIFNEPVQPVESGMRLFDSNGTATPLAATRRDNTIEAPLPERLPAGSYVVGWRVISADGHPISGAFTFAVDAASAVPIELPVTESDPATDVLLGVTQGIAYLGLLAATGLAMFREMLLNPAERRRIASRWLIVTALVAAVATLLAVPLTVIRQQGQESSADFTPAQWMPLVNGDARLALGVTLLGLAGIIFLAPRTPDSWRRGVLLVASLVALASLVMTGHTRIFLPAWLVVGADLVHVVTGAIWFGGLIGLALFLRGTLHEAGPRRDARVASCVATVVARFSGAMSVCIALLGIAGIAMGWVILGSLEALLNTTYGRILILKVVVVAVAVAIGGWNRFRLVPRVTAGGNVEDSWSRLRRTVTAEALLIVAAVLATGFLVNQSPVLADTISTLPSVPSQPAATPTPELMIMGELGDVSLHGTLTPGAVGENTLEFGLHDEHGMPVEPLDNPQIALSLPEHDLGPLRAEAAPTGEPGMYATQVNVPLAGEWELAISARVSRFEEPTTTMTITIPK